MSKTALLKITDNKRNQRQKLPLAADLIALRDFLLKQIRKLTSVLMVQRTNPVVWTALSRLILVRIVVFNKRRSGEASKMLLADYVDRPKCSDPDVLHQLTAVEKHLCKRGMLNTIIHYKQVSVPEFRCVHRPSIFFQLSTILTQTLTYNFK